MRKTPGLTAILLSAITTTVVTSTHASDGGWSLVAHVGSSNIEDQSASIINATDITNGPAQVSLDSGFTAGLSVRHDYEGTPWISELGWEYRSNDAQTTTSDNTRLPDGNYASNIFFLNARYQLDSGPSLTPWVGAGITWVQEIDLDSEDPTGERSFSDSGATGYQLMLGADYQLTDNFYITGELRYSGMTGIDLTQEGGSGEVRNLDYQPITLGLGIGYQFRGF